MSCDPGTGTVLVMRRRRFGGGIVIVSLGSLPSCTAELLALLNSDTTGASIVDSNYNQTCNSTTDTMSEILSNIAYNFPTLKAADEVIAFRHVNGDLSYLYRPPVVVRHIKRPSRRTIHQPCWSRHRWKSLT